MRNNNIYNLGGVIKIARLNKRITRKELSEKLHISQRHLTAIENESLPYQKNLNGIGIDVCEKILISQELQ